MNTLKAFAFAALVLIAPIAAHATNKIPLKPDGANDAPATVFGVTNGSDSGLSVGKTTVPGEKVDVVGNFLLGNLLILSRTQVGTASGQNTGINVSTTIPATSSYETLISSGSDIVLTATPTVSTTSTAAGPAGPAGTALRTGTFIVLTSTAAVGTITLQDEGSLTGSKLQLGASTRVIGQNDMLGLIFDASVGFWKEAFFVNN